MTGTLTSAASTLNGVSTIQEAVIGPSITDPTNRALRVVSNNDNPMLVLDRTTALGASAMRFSGSSTGENQVTITNTPVGYTRPGASGAGSQLLFEGGNAGIDVFGRMRLNGMDFLVAQGDVQTLNSFGLHPASDQAYATKILSMSRVQVVFNLAINSILAGRVSSFLIQNGVGGAAFTYRGGATPPIAGTPNNVGVIVNSVQYSGAAAASQSLVLGETPEWSSVAETILVRIGNIDSAANAPNAAITVTLELTLLYSDV